MVPQILDQCRRDPALFGVEFKELNLLELSLNECFDVITANAVVYLFSADELNLAFQNIVRALKPGGWFMAFDFFHPFEQDLEVFEKSKTHPDGLMLHLRPYSKVITSLEDNHLTNTTFRPFSIPVDLAKPESLDDLTSHTVMSRDGERMLFRGILYQPWCFLATQKKVLRSGERSGES
jgi:SAM-dependent methyltransferase